MKMIQLYKLTLTNVKRVLVGIKRSLAGGRGALLKRKRKRFPIGHGQAKDT